MPSTYSNLKIQLMATGENTTTWGDVTNINLGTALEEAIVGSADVTFASANVTLSLTNTNASQTARNMRLRCTGTTGGSTRNLVVPSIEKPYLVTNDCADSIVVKTAAGTGITVPAGKSMWVYNDGTNVVDATTYLTSLALGTALSVSSGGTGSNTLTSGYLVKGNGTSAVTASVVYDDGTNVGIGTSSPGAKLAVAGTAKIGEGAASNTSKLMVNTASGVAAGIQLFQDANESWIIQNPASTTALTFANSGTERMRITSAGDVGIGTSSPGYKLSVNDPGTGLGFTNAASGNFNIGLLAGTGSAEAYVYQRANNPLIFGTSNTERMRIDSAGNVGIGTSSPQRPLHVAYLSTAVGAYTAVLQGQTGGYGAGVSFQSQLTGGALAEMARITADGEAAWDTTAANQDAGLRFYTALDGTVAEKMRITSAGNVGIGTTAPSYTLDVRTNASNALRVGSSSNAFGTLLSWDNPSGEARLTSLGAYSLTFGTNSTERMLIDSSGNVGIGTSSPSSRLHVAGSGDVTAYVTTSSVGGSNLALTANSSGAGELNMINGFPLLFKTSNTERMRIDSSGNVGIGVIPGTWNLGGSTIQLGAGGAFLNGANASTTLGQNARYQSGWKYVIDGYASRYYQSSGQHQWFVAPSGTAGAAISFTTAMTLDASGNLGIGTSSPASKLDVSGTVTATSFSGAGTGLTGTASSLTVGNATNAINVTGTVGIANGGTGATTAAAALTALGAYPSSNPAGYTTNTGTVTSVGGTGSVNGITLTGSVTSSGSLTLGGTLSGVSLTTQVTGTLPIANGGTGATDAATARTNLGFANGTYTPTLTNVSNIDSSTAYVCQYMRVGNVVTVSGKVTIDATSSGYVVMRMSLPIASNFSTDGQCGGTYACASSASANLAGQIYSDATNDVAVFTHGNNVISPLDFYFSFTYQVI